MGLGYGLWLGLSRVLVGWFCFVAGLFVCGCVFRWGRWVLDRRKYVFAVLGLEGVRWWRGDCLRG